MMDQSEIHNLLNSFTPVRLVEMEGVKLMNRVETKYVFCSDRLPELLNLVKENYKVLEIDELRSFPYCTTYLDTSDFLFYTQQVRGKLNRHKVRYRRYETTGISYLEIKKKTNKRRTIKRRIENFLKPDSPDAEAIQFINKYLPDKLPDLHPVLINGFSRITLVGKECMERITIDYNITFASPYGKISSFPFLAIAELKREKHSFLSAFGLTMKQMGIHPGSFSKYCIGSALIMNMPRKNLLKPNLLLINKMQNEYFDSHRA
jgi:hypothetical protein